MTYRTLLSYLAKMLKFVFMNPTTIVVWLLIGFVTYNFFIKRKNDDFEKNKQLAIEKTANIVSEMRNIGEWQFMSVNATEIVDTVIKGVIFDDEIKLLYQGTMRLGINFNKINQDWFYSPHPDTIFCYLPEINLLDENFINETSTKILKQKGKIDSSIRKSLTKKAKTNMISRHIDSSTISKARQSANTAIMNFLEKFNFKHIEIMWTEPNSVPSTSPNSSFKPNSTTL